MKPKRVRRPEIGIVMGSQSDWQTLRPAAETLETLGIEHEVRVVSAHRTPDLLFDYAAKAAARGLKAIIAGAGGAAHLPGMLAAKTVVPVLGVPVQSHALNGLDSLLSIVQMPAGVPVATFAIGKAGAINAALFAAALLALEDDAVAKALATYRAAQTEQVLSRPDLRKPGHHRPRRRLSPTPRLRSQQRVAHIRTAPAMQEGVRLRPSRAEAGSRRLRRRQSYSWEFPLLTGSFTF
jgi:5-(carboxyamino)imidazole ribonucleotide mutase